MSECALCSDYPDSAGAAICGQCFWREAKHHTPSHNCDICAVNRERGDYYYAQWIEEMHFGDDQSREMRDLIRELRERADEWQANAAHMDRFTAAEAAVLRSAANQVRSMCDKYDPQEASDE